MCMFLQYAPIMPGRVLGTAGVSPRHNSRVYKHWAANTCRANEIVRVMEAAGLKSSLFKE